MLRLRYGVSLGIVVFSLQAFAADPDNGERLAQRWCAACHVVTPAQTSTTTDQAPPFPVIAKKPGFDAGKDRPVPARSASKNAGYGFI